MFQLSPDIGAGSVISCLKPSMSPKPIPDRALSEPAWTATKLWPIAVLDDHWTWLTEAEFTSSNSRTELTAVIWLLVGILNPTPVHWTPRPSVVVS